MSLDTQYRTWSISSTWAGGLGFGPLAGTHCRYILTARDLVPVSQQGILYTTRPASTRTVAVTPGREWRIAPPSTSDYNIQFTGGGLGRGPSFLPGSASVSWPSCPSTGSHIWYSGGCATAQRFNGRGMVVDCSDALGAGVGIQLLAFNLHWNVIPDVALIRDIISWIRTGDMASVREHIPMGAVCYGIQFGVAVGVTVYYGGWWASAGDTVTLPVAGPTVGRALPDGHRPPSMGGTRARFTRR